MIDWCFEGWVFQSPLVHPLRVPTVAAAAFATSRRSKVHLPEWRRFLQQSFRLSLSRRQRRVVPVSCHTAGFCVSLPWPHTLFIHSLFPRLKLLFDCGESERKCSYCRCWKCNKERCNGNTGAIVRQRKKTSLLMHNSGIVSRLSLVYTNVVKVFLAAGSPKSIFKRDFWVRPPSSPRVRLKIVLTHWIFSFLGLDAENNK